MFRVLGRLLASDLLLTTEPTSSLLEGAEKRRSKPLIADYYREKEKEKVSKQNIEAGSTLSGEGWMSSRCDQSSLQSVWPHQYIPFPPRTSHLSMQLTTESHTHTPHIDAEQSRDRNRRQSNRIGGSRKNY